MGAGLFPLAYIDFQQDPPEDLLESIDEELANLMLPTAIECEWRSLAASKGNEVSSELAVIHFKGTCAVTVTLTEIHPGPLGWTDLSDGEILPFSKINCDGVRLFLRRDLLRRMPEVNREVAYRRAIARVLAHELYHIFARTTKHAAWGIGQPTFTAQELLSNKSQFKKKECDLLRAHQAHLVSVGDEAGR